MVMPRKQVLVQLSEELVAALDAEAEQLGTSRSAVLREAASRYVKERDDARITQQIVDGYTRFPQTDDEEDDWGRLSAWQDLALENMWRQANVDERAAGLEPPA